MLLSVITGGENDEEQDAMMDTTKNPIMSPQASATIEPFQKSASTVKTNTMKSNTSQLDASYKASQKLSSMLW